ncbi:hypothetical protein AMTR_s00059p00132030 [Amborella trichopoda]|uniref:Pentatricopeptide repeat-containing protein n=1 Tax=Amborella trichopoda TaxID=13333 RepID=U5D562_AMBTC|nr:hypothetical protein AMTR_s00059p00132030 [Amborella trichopoda]
MPNLFPLLPHLSVSLSTCSYGHQVHQSCLSLLNKCTSLKQLKQVQAQTFKEAIGTDPYTLSKLIEFCALSTSNLLFYAFSLFILIPEPNLFVYNTMIRGSVRNDRPCEAILLYNQMRERNILPNNFSYPFLFNACEKTLAINHGLKLHGGVLRSGFCSDPFVMTTLLTMYAKFGMLQSSAHVFDEMAMRDTVSWNSLIGAYINHGDMEKAQWYFHRMPKRSLIKGRWIKLGFCSER